MNGISRDYFDNLLSYDKESGEFIWLEHRGSIKKGKPAGAKVTSRGVTYINIKIDKKLIKAHRLAWFLSYGEWPKERIDHINGDGTDNRLSNLRLCTHSQNLANSKRRIDNKSGFKGVSLRNGMWRAYINRDGKRMWLGNFTNKHDAATARFEAASRLFGDFAR